MFFQILAFILPCFQQFLLKGMLVFSHKMDFIENETALLCVTMRERARAFAATLQCINYSKYIGVQICFYSCRYQNQNFSLVSHSYRSCSTRVALVSHSCFRVSLVSCSYRSCRTRVGRVWHSCCKLDQITLVIAISN